MQVTTSLELPTASRFEEAGSWTNDSSMHSIALPAASYYEVRVVATSIKPSPELVVSSVSAELRGRAFQ